MKRLSVAVLAIFILALVAGCGGGGNNTEKGEEQNSEQGIQTGTLEFRANGEDFVRKGFTSKDGWNITFDNIYINLAEVTAYQADPPYDAEEGGEVKAKTQVGLEGIHTVDLAEGGEDADPVLVGKIKDAPVGHYNALSWKMVNADQGPAKSYSLVIDGKAEKGGETIDFVIKDATEYKYTGGEYVGDERKGFVKEDKTGELEMTFHFDHIFGDAGMPADDELNTRAPGFAPFAGLAQNGKVEVSVAELKDKLDAETFNNLKHSLVTLGHVGEGHCHSEILSE